jgi:cation diffusion facilitator CzcD-associated flavoprotein CzcO
LSTGKRGDEYVKERAKIEKQLLDHTRTTVPEKYHEILTPDYGVGCKRRIFDATWFPGLNDPKIELTTLPITSIQSKEVTLGPGRSYPDPKMRRVQ